MTEEFQNEPENKIGNTGMIFSIIWLILLITIIFSLIWLPLLFIWFILWIIWLCKEPKRKARIAVVIPLIVFSASALIYYYAWTAIKTSAEEFWNWADKRSEKIDNDESFDNDRYNEILNEETNYVFHNMSKAEIKSLLKNSSWSNIFEKWSNAIFWLVEQTFESALEKYYNELEEVNNTESLNNGENTDTENIEIFTESGNNDIEQILEILE